MTNSNIQELSLQELESLQGAGWLGCFGAITLHVAALGGGAAATVGTGGFAVGMAVLAVTGSGAMVYDRCFL